MTHLLVNNLYILDSKIKLPMDVLNHMKFFIGNPLVEAIKYRQEIQLNSIVDSMNKYSTKLHLKKPTGYSREFDFYISEKITNFLLNIDCRIDKVLYSLNREKILTKLLSKNKYHIELMKYFEDLIFLSYDPCSTSSY